MTVIKESIEFSVAVVFDTSYLMELPVSACPDLECGEYLSWTFSTGRQIRAWHWNFTHFVPSEIKSEVAKHYGNQDKRSAAVLAKRNLTDLISSKRFECPSLCDFPAVEVDSILGADSEVDKRLIGFLLQLERSTFNAVVLATNDSGIALDIATLRRERKSLKIHAISADQPYMTSLKTVLREVHDSLSKEKQIEERLVLGRGMYESAEGAIRKWPYEELEPPNVGVNRWTTRQNAQIATVQKYQPPSRRKNQRQFPT